MIQNMETMVVVQCDVCNALVEFNGTDHSVPPDYTTMLLVNDLGVQTRKDICDSCLNDNATVKQLIE